MATFETVAPAQTKVTLTTLHSFGASQDAGGDSLDGSNPQAALLQGSDGNFYGTTAFGGPGAIIGGTVFRMAADGTLTILQSLESVGSSGTLPLAGLTQDRAGNLYGTTSSGGVNDIGTIFKIATNGVLTTLYSFGSVQDASGNPVDGWGPQGGLVQGSDGNFYGTTTMGGDFGGDFLFGAGTVFKMNTNGTLIWSVLFEGTNGFRPTAGLLQGTDGNFYGTTSLGGSGFDATNDGSGTVFKITSDGILTSLYSFTDGADGGNPAAGLVQGRDAIFYGTTEYGGSSYDTNSSYGNSDNGFGTIFRITTNGVLTSLYSFGAVQDAFGDPLDGSNPMAALLQGSDGNFYGTTSDGGLNYDTNSSSGISGYGTVFKITTNGVLTTLHSFGSIQDAFGDPLDGSDPKAALIQGSDGNFYGTTYLGGANYDFNTAAPSADGYGTTFVLFLPGTPPSIVLQPTNLTVYLGEIASLNVLAGGTPPLVYQWLKNGTNLNDGGSISGATTATLTLSSVSAADAGNYSVEVTNAFGKANSVSAILTVSTSNIPDLPNLVVTSVLAPSNAVGGQPIDVTWTVCNNGPASTDVPVWYDQLYLSPTTNIADAVADFGAFENPSYLASGGCYDQTATVDLPLGIGGPFYILVQDDSTGELVQANTSAHLGWTVKPMDIQLVTLGFLHVVSVQVAPAPPTSSWAGQSVTVTWTVQNTGQSAINGSWTDDVDLSPTPIYDSVHGYFEVTWAWNYGPLGPGASYTDTEQFYLPAGITPGQWYAALVVDPRYSAQDAQFNSGDIGRDQNSAPLNVIAVPPADLEVTSLHTLTNVSPGQTINVQWTVANDGLNQTTVGNWYDAVYLSSNADFNPSRSVLLATVDHWGDLGLDASYTQNWSVTVPANTLGTNSPLATNYLFVLADGGNVVAEIQNTIHFLGVPLIVSSLPAELAVTTVAAPSTAVAGRTVNITWSVQNIGAATTSATNWMDSVYLSSSTNLDNSEAIWLGNVPFAGTLAPGDSYAQSLTFSLPSCAGGAFYVLVEADSGHQVNAVGSPANDVRAASNVTRVFPSPAARLEVAAVSSSENVTAGGSLVAVWTVTNAGYSTTNAPWIDGLYLSTSSQFDPSNALLIGTYPRAGNLAEGDSYTQVQTNPVPSCFSGPYFVYVVTDLSNVVNDISCQTNDWGRSATTVQVASVDYPALQVTGMSLPPSVNAGVPWTLQWTVTNVGPGAASGPWSDAVYASLLPALDTNALLLGQYGSAHGLPSHGSYVQTQSVALPACLSGDFYLFVVADVDNQVDVPSCQINNQARSTSPLLVNFGLYPDLVVQGMQLPSTAYGGQSMSVSWTVENTGMGAALGVWTDSLYLSPSGTFALSDSVFLGAYSWTGSLAAGAAYTQTENVPVPTNLFGNFHVAVVTDSSNTVEECLNPDNNTLVSVGTVQIPITIYPDLAVPVVQVTNNAFSGQSVTVAWVVTNDGTAPTGGTAWYDKLYLSQEQGLNPAAIELGTYPAVRSLAVGQSYTNTETVVIPSYAAGPYYIIVLADSGGDLFDGFNEKDNVGA
ncbi:MAG: choice-of-anchor tandem repeat GloVer-containing protein, partial [Limisphaerales bacterium]